MKLNDELVKKILLEGGYITEEDIIKAEEHAKDYRSSITEYLFLKELLSKDILGQAIADHLGIEYADLNSKIPSKDQVFLLPEDITKEFRVVVFSQEESEVVMATDDPHGGGLLEAVKPFFSNKKITFAFSMPEDIDNVFADYYKGFHIGTLEEIKEKGLTAPETINKLIEDALVLKASDIHFEPEEESAFVRFRVDGVLHDIGEIPKEYYENIVSRLKVQAKLRIDEHFTPQDGAIRFSSPSYEDHIDLRVSIIPTLDGEKVVVRVLSSYVRDLTLSDIGLSDRLQEQITKSIKKPFGMILVVGPTGSGKTTTLYSVIKMLNTRKVNITTIEDPVEYKIKGVNQIQINPQAGFTFANSLRAVMRQDPNTIFVGEIRDLETAEIAVNAALTGHLLLSTFHANNSVSVIPRILDMGVDSFLVGSTIELVVSQRLVRRICDFCKVSYILKKEDSPEIVQYFNEDSVNLYKGKGCEHCSNTGYKGRVGVFEFLSFSQELQDLTSKEPSTNEVLQLAREQGFVSMFEDGMEKVRLGITTIDELLRVVEH